MLLHELALWSILGLSSLSWDSSPSCVTFSMVTSNFITALSFIKNEINRFQNAEQKNAFLKLNVYILIAALNRSI